MLPKFAPSSDRAVPLHIIEKDGLQGWAAGQGDVTRQWIASSGFDASLGTVLAFPDSAGHIAAVLVGWGSRDERARGRFHLAQAVASLPPGSYRLASGIK
jgi:leucyl aminopeptidase